MNKHELLKQADYNFQRGNRALAKKYISDLLAEYPNDEAAWMLMARVSENTERRVEAYTRALKLNPNNNEAKIGLIRAKSASPTLPLKREPIENGWQGAGPISSTIRVAIISLVILLALGTTTYVIARNDPESSLAKLIIPSTVTPIVNSLSQDIAPQTRAEVGKNYPQYAPLVDALIALAIHNAENGMDGAPQRPGAEITPFEGAGEEARAVFQGALPEPGSLSSVTLNEQQATSWLMLELNKNPDLPFKDIQVYLRDDTIQVWGTVTGDSKSTSALVTLELSQDERRRPVIKIDSIQIGKQSVPDILTTQMEGWLNEWISQAVDQQVAGLQIMNVNISNGLITISGMR